MIAKQVSRSNFWDTDLEDVEAVFLADDSTIVDLPTNTDDRVPAQGSVLLQKVINIDAIVDKPSLLKRWAVRIGFFR